MQVKNISNGPRGIWSAAGDLVTLQAGETRDIDLAKSESAGEWFEFGQQFAEEAAPSAPTKKAAVGRPAGKTSAV